MGNAGTSVVLCAAWDGKNITVKSVADFKAVAPAPLALPNEVMINKEAEGKMLYVVLNGNNQLVKINLDTHTTVYSVNAGVAPYGLTMVNHKVFVTNWGGQIPTDTSDDKTAGVPYGAVSVDPVTGATAGGSVSVFNPDNGQLTGEIKVGLHPNDIIHSPNGQYVYVANANSDNVTVLNSASLVVTETISVRLHTAGVGDLGDSPNALAISPDGSHLYVANGLDNALAVIKLGAAAANPGKGASQVEGFIPTETYPGGLAILGDKLVVANIEGIGARVNSREINNPAKDKAENEGGAYNSHKQKATVTIISVPDEALLATYTQKVNALNLAYRTELSRLKPRNHMTPKPSRSGLANLLYLNMSFTSSKKTAPTTRF
ncbi:YncE family protein [Pinibacter soli]|uniref:YncE family protein n=1 Tax=Pinibacter soli TaxID=3044211 RepID=A0ABT6RBX3_9BACT|nr:YncE family protein [Pinibacter soli]MDI3319424.1 YncE family protein [Pinibacter soli]